MNTGIGVFLALLVAASLVLFAVTLPSAEPDPYEAAWDACIAAAEANPPAEDEFQIPPDELCELHESTVGREQFVSDFG